MTSDDFPAPMRADLAPGHDRDARGGAPARPVEPWRDFVQASGVVDAVRRSERPAEALLWVALAGQGARLVPGGVVHDGRRLAVVVVDGDGGAAEGVYLVPAARCLRSPAQAALDVLVACRERGAPVGQPWWELEGAVPGESTTAALEAVELGEAAANEKAVLP